MDETIGLLSVELRTLLIGAEVGSFSGAARRLKVQQSTVSRRIRDLEDRIGVSLFERYPHGLRLTVAGSVFLDQVVRANGILTSAVAEARHAGAAGSGLLRLGFVWSFAAGSAREIIAAYRDQNPKIHLYLTELGAAELLKRALAREIDCAWIVTWRKPDPGLECETLWSEALYLARQATGAPTEPAGLSELASQPYLCRSTDEWSRFQRLSDQVGGPQMDIRTHDCSHESLLSLVAAGDGLTLMPESIASRGHPGVQFVPLSDPRARLEICAIWRRETDNPALRRFMALTRSWLKKNRPSDPAPPAPA